MTIFNSRDTKYKSPFGAVSCGTPVSFTVTPGPDYCACSLVTYGEFADVRAETPLSPCPKGFTGTFTAPDTPELVWYTFRFSRTDGGSFGLGLPIARAIVEAHRGTLRCDSGGPTTRFTITLPCRQGK